MRVFGAKADGKGWWDVLCTEHTAAFTTPALIPWELGLFVGSRGWGAVRHGAVHRQSPSAGWALLPDGGHILAWSVRPSLPRSHEGLHKRWRYHGSAASCAFLSKRCCFLCLVK